jgi:hypothetical protein
MSPMTNPNVDRAPAPKKAAAKKKIGKRKAAAKKP